MSRLDPSFLLLGRSVLFSAKKRLMRRPTLEREASLQRYEEDTEKAERKRRGGG